MVALSISEGRERLLELREKVISDHDQVILTHESGNVVLISMEEWEAYRETERLVMDRAALKALLKSFEEHDAGKKGRGKSMGEVDSRSLQGSRNRHRQAGTVEALRPGSLVASDLA